MRGAVDLDGVPEVFVDFDARSGRLRRLVDEVVPRVKPNSSMEFTPFSFAKANTVFFWVSLGRIAD